MVRNLIALQLEFVAGVSSGLRDRKYVGSICSLEDVMAHKSLAFPIGVLVPT